jgi:peptidoglycan/LPS O-acetylase OafA/YrhL
MAEADPRRRLDTTLLMALAAILVANSHLERFYPYHWLAGDGLLGNSMFFLMAGYGLVRSEQVQNRSFLRWFWRRVVRIYPTLLIVMLVFAIGVDRAWERWTALGYLTSLVWPTPFTFVFLVMPFYLVFFPLMKLKGRWVYPATTGLLALIYLAAYARDVGSIHPGQALQLSARPTTVHVTAYLQVMLLGGWLAGRERGSTTRTYLRLLGTLGVGLVYLALKMVMVLGYGARAYPILHFLTYILCLALFDLLTDPQTVQFVRKGRAMYRGAGFAAALTLEIYMVHQFIVDYRWVWSQRFPWNLVLFWALTLPLAYLVGRLSRPIQMRLRGEGKPENRTQTRVPNAVRATLLSAPDGPATLAPESTFVRQVGDAAPSHSN